MPRTHKLLAARIELPETGEVFFDFDETGAILRCSRATLRRWLIQGDIAAIRIGNQVRFRASELRRFVAAAPRAEAMYRASQPPHAGLQHAA